MPAPFSIFDLLDERDANGGEIRPQMQETENQRAELPGEVGGLLEGPEVGQPDMPHFQPGGQSFLDKAKGFFRDPNEQGITGADKLFAIGSILKGDSQGGMNFLQHQRQVSDTLAERARQQAIQEGGMEALQGALRPDGTVDLGRYLALVRAKGLKGIDVTGGINAALATAPKRTVMQTSGGGVGVATQAPFGGEVDWKELQAGRPPKPPLGQRYNPETGELELDPLALQYVAQSADKRAAATAAHRAPKRGSGPARKPGQGYGASEVTFPGG